jgi:acetyltransferase-like isoleucine patch superfamily enzyme
MVMPGITMGDYSSAAPGVVVSRNVKPHRRLVPAVCRTIEV